MGMSGKYLVNKIFFREFPPNELRVQRAPWGLVYFPSFWLVVFLDYVVDIENWNKSENYWLKKKKKLV